MMATAQLGRDDAGSTRLSPGFWLGLLCVLIGVYCALDLARPAGVAVAAVISLAATAVARVRLRTLLLRLAPLLSFCVFALLLALLVPVREGMASVQVPLWGRPVAAQSLTFVTSICVRSVLIVIVATALSVRLSERGFLVGLTGLRLPAKLVGLLYLTVRGLHTVGGETRRLLRGLDSRGRARGLRAVRVAGAMAQVLLVRLGRRAETQALALVARGFEGRIAISRRRSVSPAELLVLAAAAASLIWITHL